ncbi:MAG TPA: prepilin-type N-terminal cleavage/methylation domain-containing protein [Planctomicrobium sp.]|nr:prepilin-type N-terminal cleavage/methylation domain-containing protein [Planctomicrobium sp.]
MMRAPRSAFTLVEVLIALALSVMLIFAIYASISMSYRFNIAGRAEIAGQQFMRGLTHRLNEDIGSVRFAAPEAEVDTSTGSAAEETTASDSGSFGSSFGFSSSSGETAATTLSFDGILEAGLPPAFGVVGFPDMLHLCTSLPTRERSYYSFEDRKLGNERISELLVISYGLVKLDSLTLATMEKELEISRPDQGLGRRTRDFFASDTVDEVLAMPDLIAAEVTELSFKYFDGTDWYDSWDSLAMGMLPRAIEVTYGIWNPPPKILGRGRLPGPGTVTHVAHLFYLTQSEPVVGVAP